MWSFTTFVVARRGGAVNLTTMTKNKVYVHDAAAIVATSVLSGCGGGGDIVDAIVFRHPPRSHCGRAAVVFSFAKNNKRYHTLSMRYRRTLSPPPPNSFARSLHGERRDENKIKNKTARLIVLYVCVRCRFCFIHNSVFLRHVR